MVYNKDLHDAINNLLEKTYELDRKMALTDTAPDMLTHLAKREDSGTRYAVTQNPVTSPELLAKLCTDTDNEVNTAALKALSTRMSRDKVLGYLFEAKDVLRERERQWLDKNGVANRFIDDFVSRFRKLPETEKAEWEKIRQEQHQLTDKIEMIIQ
jgi:hypothetical protein